MVPVKEILAYTPEQWRDDQHLIVERIVDGREQLGLSAEFMAEQAGYSLTQYLKMEAGTRIVELEDFLRFGEVFYYHQKSSKPQYHRQLNKLLLWFKSLRYRFLDWMEQIYVDHNMPDTTGLEKVNSR
ncbi:helix-turn-helix domain-containing protein [Daejeonella sp.]|uniref:helix-turn-helix domain-containing protein n=1 Tax=Daejeonella sp. TaxID=2805397 RepID=UPI003983577C